MPKATCMKVEYEAGERVVCEGVKGHWAGKHVGGRFFQNAGYGVGQYFIASKLILYIRLRGKKLHPVRVDRFFKDKIGKLTEQRRELIAKAMPETIVVKNGKEVMLNSDPELSKDDRTTQYRVSARDLRDWLARTQELMGKPKELQKIKQKIQKQKEAQRKEEDLKWEKFMKEEEKRRRREEVEEKARLKERLKNALKLSFVRGRNPRYGTEQWEAQHEGRLYVLQREDNYDPEEKAVPVEKRFDLVPNRIMLVERI